MSERMTLKHVLINCWIWNYREQVGGSLPKEMWDQLNSLEKRIQIFQANWFFCLLTLFILAQFLLNRHFFHSEHQSHDLWFFERSFELSVFRIKEIKIKSCLYFAFKGFFQIFFWIFTLLTYRGELVIIFSARSFSFLQKICPKSFFVNCKISKTRSNQNSMKKLNNFFLFELQ